MGIGDNIKKRREQLGISQIELAKRMGYKSSTTITKIEKGTNDVTQSTIKKFAEVLFTTPQKLMGWDEESPEVPQYDKKYYTLILLYEKLSEENKKMILDLMGKLGER